MNLTAYISKAFVAMKCNLAVARTIADIVPATKSAFVGSQRSHPIMPPMFWTLAGDNWLFFVRNCGRTEAS